MTKLPYLPLWTDAYLGDTRHLTTTEHGAYLLLLIEAWRRPKCDLPDDDALLARLTGLTTDEWASAKPVLMAFWKRDGRSRAWSQTRLKKERDYANKHSRSQSDKAVSRWEKAKKTDAAALPRQSRGNAPILTSSLPNGKGADAPPIDPKKVLFDAGVKLLTGTGLADRAARGLIAKWCRDRGDGWTREALLSADGKADPVAWIEARARSAVASEDDAAAVSRATVERYRRMAMPGPEDYARSQGLGRPVPEVAGA